MNNYKNYQVYYYKNNATGEVPVLEYILELPKKEKAKVLKYIDFLQKQKGYLDEPYSRHIRGKIRELRVDFSKSQHRIFYFTFIKQKIILLYAFSKKTKKTPEQEIIRAVSNLRDSELNKIFVEYED